MKVTPESEAKLKKAIVIKLKLITEAKIDQELKSDFEILSVCDFKPIIVTPNNISKDDYLNARVIQFKGVKIKISEKSSNGTGENMYYCYGDAKIDYLDDDFTVDLTVSNISTNLF